MFVAKPFLESIYEGDASAISVLAPNLQESMRRHNSIAKKICRILSVSRDDFRNMPKTKLERFYAELGEMLLDYPRLALYIPFYILEMPTNLFKETYLKVWRACCAMSDTREEYRIGDYYEPEASVGEPDHVVKAMHLLPWLVKYDYLDEQKLLKLASKYKNDEGIAIWGMLDGAIAAEKMGIIRKELLNKLKEVAKGAKSTRPERPKLIKITTKRQKWLDNYANNYGIDPRVFKLRNPAGPYNKNINPDEISVDIAVPEYEHLILQGSRLKGYSRPDSDYDYFIYDDRNNKMYSYEKDAGRRELNYLSEKLELMSHLILLGAWLGDDGEIATRAQYKAAKRYYGMGKMSQAVALFSIERTTVLCRLMQKGFPCAYPDASRETIDLRSIDGDSAFYDDRFRSIATEICIKYNYLGRRIDLAVWKKALAYTIPPMVS